MKKIILLAVCVILSLSIAACEDKKNDDRVSETVYNEGSGEIADTELGESGMPDPLDTVNETEGPGADTASDTSVDGTDTTISADTEVTAPTAYEPTVFMYHLILDEPYSPETSLFVSPSDFADHLDALNERDFEYIFADEYKVYSHRTAVLTFDDGYEDNYTEMFPILKEKGGKATIFLISELIGTKGYLNEEQIKEMSQSGLVSFQSHTSSHPKLAELSDEEIRNELKHSVEVIEGITGKRVTALAYPYGSKSDKVKAVAGEFFEIAYTTESPYGASTEDRMSMPRHAVLRGCVKAQFVKYLGV